VLTDFMRDAQSSPGEALAPPKEEKARVKAVAEKLHKTLCGQRYGCDVGRARGCSVDRFRVSGLRGRGTALMGSDLDIVVVLNNAAPPWDGALTDIAHRVVDQLHVDALVARCASTRACARARVH
jgi:hypothetical protein